MEPFALNPGTANVLHEAALAAQTAEMERLRPSMQLRPRLFIDGNQWCALYGENLQDGVAGFGNSPHEAMLDFDKEWHQALAKRSAGVPQVPPQQDDGEPSSPQERITKLETALKDVFDILGRRELNPSNYTHDEACELNADCIEAYMLVKGVLEGN